MMKTVKAADSGKALLTFAGVSKVYNKKIVALSDVTFSVDTGSFVTIIGPSGAGKSTLLRCINRMIDVSEGTIVFDGQDICSLGKKDLRHLRSRIGMIFQHYNLVDRLSVIENILHGRLGTKSTLAGVVGHYTDEEKRLAFKLIEILGLEAQAFQRCDQLSGGQKQRVGIGRALIQQPKLLLCDEPIASLDPNAAKVIMDHLGRVCREMGITCLVNLHQVDVALKYSDRIIGIRSGKIIYDGEPGNIATKEVEHIYGAEAGELVLSLEENKRQAI